MARKKQIIIPLAILGIGIVTMMGFASLKKPPEEKKYIDNTPIVRVENIQFSPLTLTVNSHGMVKPKYETKLVAQVTGEIVELSNEFVRGGLVKQGQLLARIDPSDYQAALIDAQATMASARAALEQEVAHGKVAEREWQQITDSSPTELSLRKPQLAQELARVKAAQASVLRAKRNLERTEIRAPYDAMIDSRHIGLGSFVSAGSQIGHILSIATAEIRLPVADNQFRFLKDFGESALVTLIGEYAGAKSQWQAKIIRSEGVVDSKSRMNYLVAEVADPYGLSSENNKIPLRFGSYVNAEILGVELLNATKIPRHLVINGQVALLAHDSSLHYTSIDIIRQQGSEVIVTQGLVDGDKLIVSALDYPVNGMKLALADEQSLVEEDYVVQPVSKSQHSNNDTGE